MFRGVVTVRQNNLDPVLAKILIKERENSVQLQIMVSIKLKETCVFLSMGASRLQF